MPDDQKALGDQLRELTAALREKADRQDQEIKTVGASFQETKNALTEISSRIDVVETLMRRPYVGSNAQIADMSAERKAFSKFVRAAKFSNMEPAYQQAMKLAGPEDAKALSLSDDTTGGFLAPDEWVKDIIKGVVLISPIRQIANVRSTTMRSVIMPVRTGLFAARWVNEITTRTETTGLQFGRQEIPNHEMYAEVIISQQDLEDSAFDLDAEIQTETAEQFAVAEGKAFVNGTGVGQPFGLLGANTGVAQDTSGTVGTLKFDDLITSMYNLKSAYAGNAQWLMRRETIGYIRGLKDTQNRYLWEPSYPDGLGGAQPATILGRPYMEVPDMPLVATGAFAVMFGDFKRAYTIIDRVQMVVKVLTEKYAESGQLAYLTRKRVGGQVVLPEAMRIIKIQ